MSKPSSVMSLRRVLGKLVVVPPLLVFLGNAPVFASALIPQVGWTLKSVDSQETRGEDGAATNAFDGDVSTIWHTQWQGSSPRHPHTIDIDLGAVYDLDGFRYLPRQDGGVNGRVARYAFYVSLDGVNWSSAVATGTFPNSAQQQEVLFVLTQGRYIRFEALSEVNGRAWTSVAELKLLGAVPSGANIEPNGAPVSASALIPQMGWTLESVDSQETRGEDGAATNAFDGDVSTFWHTQWQGSSPRHPHRIDIDLGAVHDLDGFRYLPRQDGGVNGRVARYAFYVSLDGVNWGGAVATGTFPNTAQEQEVSFALTQGRYIRFEALSDVNGRAWTSVAELNLLGAASSGANIEPNGVINSPGDGATVEVGGALNFTGSGSDPDSNALLSYRWTFGDPTVADLTVKDPPNVMFNTPGTHTVTFTVVDHLGLADSTPATIRVTVNSVSTASVIPQTGVISRTGWRLKSVDSQETKGEDGAATNAFDGDVRTIWHTQWQGASPRHPHRIDIDLGAVHDLDGFRYLPRQDGGVNGRVARYAFYVSLDGVNWGGAVATGTFPNTAQEQEVSFALTQGRYIRFEALSDVNGRAWTSVAELKLLGTVSSGGNGGVTPQGNTGNYVLHADFENRVANSTYTETQLIEDFNANNRDGRIHGPDFGNTRIVRDPAGNTGRGNVLRIRHPAGQFGSAASFKARFAPDNQNKSGSARFDDVYFAYDIYLSPGTKRMPFHKLPGLITGTLLEASHNSNVVPVPEGVKAFTALMQTYASRVWSNRPDGVLSLYYYDAGTVQSDDFLDTVNPTQEDPNHSYIMPLGEWITIEQRVKLNTADSNNSYNSARDKENGLAEVWINGTKMSSQTHLWRHTNTMKADGFWFYSYYNNRPDITAPPSSDQYEYYDKFRVSTSPITH